MLLPGQGDTAGARQESQESSMARQEGKEAAVRRGEHTEEWCPMAEMTADSLLTDRTAGRIRET